jgi:hypothetical protein
VCVGGHNPQSSEQQEVKSAQDTLHERESEPNNLKKPEVCGHAFITWPVEVLLREGLLWVHRQQRVRSAQEDTEKETVYRPTTL